MYGFHKLRPKQPRNSSSIAKPPTLPPKSEIEKLKEQIINLQNKIHFIKKKPLLPYDN